MTNGHLELIEQFFRRNEDGDFLYPEPGTPYWLIGPSGSSRELIYGTKGALVRAFEDTVLCEGLGIVGRYGLPNRREVDWLRALLGSRALLFCGDLDPTDLLIYAWLRIALAPAKIAHFGINDRLLDALACSIPQSFFIRNSDTENAGWELLQIVLPDVRSLVGPDCADVLKRGDKLEIEALISSGKRITDVLQPGLLPEN